MVLDYTFLIASTDRLLARLTTSINFYVHHIVSERFYIGVRISCAIKDQVTGFELLKSQIVGECVVHVGLITSTNQEAEVVL